MIIIPEVTLDAAKDSASSTPHRNGQFLHTPKLVDSTSVAEGLI